MSIQKGRNDSVTGVPPWLAASGKAKALIGAGRLRTRAGQTARHREDPAVAARRAGDRGRHAEPMDSARRIEAYNRETGRTRQDLTPKQRRRANKKLIGELKRMPVEVITP